MKKEENLLKLIHKRLTGELKETENQTLESLLKDDDNKLIANREGKIWNKSKDYKKGFEPNVEAGLSKLKSQIRATQTPVAKEIKLNRRSWLTKVAAAAVLLVGAWFVWNTSNSTLQEIATTDNTQEIQLADNTEVTINRGSDFNYPAQFNSAQRKVELQGEAFFDVARNPEQPFIIQTGNLQVRVLGTSFNIRNYDNEDLAEITVRSGKVEVSTLNGEQKWILEANDQLRFDKKEKKVKTSKDVSLNALAWFNGKLSFQDEKLERVKQAIEHVYNVELEFTNSSVLKCEYTINGNLKEESLTDVLEALRLTFEMEAVEQVNSGKYLLKGGRKCKN